MITMRLPTDEDIAELAANMRQSDIDELTAVCAYPPDEALILSVQVSDPHYLFAAHANGKLLCIGGASEIGDDSPVGIPWLLATPLMDRYHKRLTRDAKKAVRAMLERWPVLTNVVDVRNAKTIRWLRAIGFDMVEQIELKPGLPVYRFEMRAKHV